MKKILSLLVLSVFFCGGLVFAADSASNRKDMTLRLGMKTGIHLMYATSTPFVLEFPGEDWTFGLTYGSGKYSYSYMDYNSSTGYSTKAQNINFSTAEVTGRYYIGNSFNIPFGYASYKISYPDWVYSGVTYDIDYSITQLNYGIGNEWTYDWGGYLGIDWFQGGAKLSDKVSVKHKSGTVSDTSKKGAEKESTDVGGFAGALIFTFGFGF